MGADAQIVDWGYTNCGAGWFDVSGQGFANDYCRWVGNCGCRGGCSWWSCAVAGTDIRYTLRGEYKEGEVTGPYTKGSVTPGLLAQTNAQIADWGYTNCGA